MKKIVLVTFIITSLLQLRAQYVGVYEVSEGNCDFFIREGNWPEAVKCFSELLENDTSNLDYKYKLAKGYTFSNINKRKALNLLLKLDLVNYAANDFDEVFAQAYFFNYNFTKAKTLFSQLAEISQDSEVKIGYKKLIDQCDFAEEMIRNPVAVDFENLGANVNSDAPDFLPFVNPDESNVYFTTKREGVVGNLGSSEGFKTADIYYVKHKRNNYSRARSVGSPNTFGNEFTAGNSENGNYLIYTVNNEEVHFDLFVSELGRRSYMVAEPINYEELSKSAEQGASLASDGQKFYFASDIEGGYGGYDLYVIKRLPNESWGQMKNLGSTVNTEGDEMYPMITDDSKTLYFSSNSHLGMGGMDLFKSSMSEDKQEAWKQPINLGHPINTPYDDLNISYARNRRYAYMAKRFDDSFGDLDIYRLTFFDEKDEYTLLTGRVLDQDSTALEAYVTVEVLHEETGNLIGTYIKNQKNGKYSAILAPGNYSVEVIGVGGFKDFQKGIEILGKNNRSEMRVLDLILEQE
ncbi:MAG: tetratricopeptide (TPR) repeat protein [Vicingaceae bacterium]|jgi:tetratricopeptide (TPR) repeat protein